MRAVSDFIANITVQHKYKVIAFCEERSEFTFQCVRTRAIYSEKAMSVVMDDEIINNLHPEQACYVGLKVGALLRKKDRVKAKLKRNFAIDFSEKKKQVGMLIIDRYSNLIFTHPKTKKRCSIKIEYIIADKELINLFSPSAACYLGIYMGRRKSFVANSVIDKRCGQLKLVVNN